MSIFNLIKVKDVQIGIFIVQSQAVVKYPLSIIIQMKAIDLLYAICKTNIDNRDYFESVNGSAVFHDVVQYYMDPLMAHLSNTASTSSNAAADAVINNATVNDIVLCLKKVFHLLRLLSKSEDNKGKCCGELCHTIISLLY